MTAFQLRPHQKAWIDKVEIDLATHKRLLFVAPGGVGKSTCFAELAKRFWARGKRSLILANRDSLVRQTAGRIEKETGLEVGIEMASEYSSPHCPITVASVQTLGKINRLTSFDPLHFALCVPDEAHFSLSPQWKRCLNYVHFGAESLADGWVEPPKEISGEGAAIVGFTATPQLPKKSLLDYYQAVTVNYSFIEAVEEGWLCAPVQKSIPVRIDLRKRKVVNGDFTVHDLQETLIPVMEELADQTVAEAVSQGRKTMCFLPSVETAKMLSDALVRRGVNSVFVSGACVDGDEKTEHFRNSGAGSVLCNAQIYNFGVDFPDVSAIGWYRATLSKAFYIQGVYRASRVLPGVVDGLTTAEERLAAIAASAKKNFLILDPTFVHERIDLCDAFDLYTGEQGVKDRMKESGGLDPETAKEATRDFLKALEKEMKKHARKAARTINPLAFAVSLGEASIADYKPETQAEAGPLTAIQIEYLKAAEFNYSVLTCAGQADKIIKRLETRKQLGLASPKMLQLLLRLGLPEEQAALMKKGQAGAIIGAKTAAWRR